MGLLQNTAALQGVVAARTPLGHCHTAVQCAMGSVNLSVHCHTAACRGCGGLWMGVDECGALLIVVEVVEGCGCVWSVVEHDG